ncbi:MAG: MBOAT family protein [Chlorobi bacterium]|nr:MBOAT family protein [Chlorobiota bacterium]
MLFNSLIFLVFAILFFSLWPLLKKRTNVRLSFIVIASFFFYGWWDWRFLFLIAGSGLLDYFSGIFLLKYPNRKKLFLLLSVVGNIGSLMAFKYSGFFAENIDSLFALLGYNTCIKCNIPDFFLVTPVGISFYTFQSMSYTLDIYKGTLKPTRNVIHFFAYLSMFPQLVAGPIVRASDLLSQLLKYPKTTEQDRWEGMRLIVHGFFKKMVIADNLAPFVNKAFVLENMSDSSLYWWVSVTAFAFQIYCDFSGYSDIARGLARLMGLNFKLNFNHPYTSLSIREFWTRWHISLSTWFKDYVYIPLGGSRKNKFSGHYNMWITMLISGFWHGAAWTFILWGAVHSFFLSLERIFKWPNYFKKSSLGRVILLLLIMLQVWVAWVFFRAQSFSQAIDILKIMFSFNGNVKTSIGLNEIFFILIGIIREIWIYHGFSKESLYPKSWSRTMDVVTMAILITICVFMRGPGNEFIYFQF